MKPMSSTDRRIVTHRGQTYVVSTVVAQYPVGANRTHVQATKGDHTVRNPNTLAALARLIGMPDHIFNSE